MWQFSAVYHDRYEEFPVDVAHDDVPHESRSRFFVIYGYRKSAYIVPYDGDYPIAPFGLNRATRNGHYSVTVLREKADLATEFACAYGQLKFVSVTVFQIAPYRGRNVIVDERYFRQTVFYYLTFKF